MLHVAYDITSFTQNHLGGIARVCYQTIKQAKAHPDMTPEAFYRNGTTRFFDVSNIPLQKISFINRFFSKKFQIAHSLCHRLLSVKADLSVYTVHDVWSLQPNKYQSNDFQKKLSARLKSDIRKADHIVTISKTTMKNLLSCDIIPPEKCSYVHLGVEPFQKNPKLTDQSIAALQQKKYILYVGCLEYRKNISHILEAVSPIKNLHLVIAGNKGFGYEEQIKPKLNAFPSERLHIFNAVERTDLSYLYKNAVAAILPSWEEGFGLPIVEAMINNCPIITSNRSANAEIGGEAAILINPEDPTESKIAIEQLLEDSNFRKEKISAGMKRAELFTWQAYMQKMVLLYQSLLK